MSCNKSITPRMLYLYFIATFSVLQTSGQIKWSEVKLSEVNGCSATMFKMPIIIIQFQDLYFFFLFFLFSFVRGQDSTMWDIVWVSPQGHRSVSVSRHFLLQTPQCPCSVRKPFSRGHCCRGRSKPVAGLWGHTLGENWPPEPTSSYASIDFWCQLVANLATTISWMSVVAMVG